MGTFNSATLVVDYSINSKVPELSTSVDANPDMYCNYAREEPFEERCLACKEACNHSGTHTIMVTGIRTSVHQS